MSNANSSVSGTASSPVLTSSAVSPASDTSPVSAASSASTVQPDPISDPSGFLGDVRDSYRSSQWALLVVLALYGIARAGQWAAAKWKLAWLDGWKLKAIVTAVSLLGAVLVSIGDTGKVDAYALAGAVAAAVALYLQPDRSTPSSASPTPADPVAPSSTPETSGDA